MRQRVVEGGVLLGRSSKKIGGGHKNYVISVFKYLEGKCKGGNK